uniref:Uncharacterized protein n=1 Tax=Aegilops tauschii subsp. strangulata TaxID=200361 RepID=A0A453PAF5_AEGTS
IPIAFSGQNLTRTTLLCSGNSSVLLPCAAHCTRRPAAPSISTLVLTCQVSVHPPPAGVHETTRALKLPPHPRRKTITQARSPSSQRHKSTPKSTRNRANPLPMDQPKPTPSAAASPAGADAAPNPYAFTCELPHSIYALAFSPSAPVLAAGSFLEDLHNRVSLLCFDSVHPTAASFRAVPSPSPSTTPTRPPSSSSTRALPPRPSSPPPPTPSASGTPPSTTSPPPPPPPSSAPSSTTARPPPPTSARPSPPSTGTRSSPAASGPPPSTPPAPSGTSSAASSRRSSSRTTRPCTTSPGGRPASSPPSPPMAPSASLISGTRSTPPSSTRAPARTRRSSGLPGTAMTYGTWPPCSWTATPSLCSTYAHPGCLWPSYIGMGDASTLLRGHRRLQDTSAPQGTTGRRSSGSCLRHRQQCLPKGLIQFLFMMRVPR